MFPCSFLLSVSGSKKCEEKHLSSIFSDLDSVDFVDEEQRKFLHVEHCLFSFALPENLGESVRPRFPWRVQLWWPVEGRSTPAGTQRDLGSELGCGPDGGWRWSQI